MALPKIDLPSYSHKLVGINKKIKYRPFTVKEQKILLAAKGEGEKENIVGAIKQIIELCTFGKVEVDSLPIFDIEDLFVRIRSKSVEEIVRLPYAYEYTDEEGKTKKDKVIVEIKLDDLKVTTPEGHTKKIMVTESVGVMMKYPSLDMMMGGGEIDEMELICSHIDNVFDANEVYQMGDQSPEEVEEFFESLDSKALMAIKNFFETMPRIRHQVEIPLKDGTVETIKYEGINDFFV